MALKQNTGIYAPDGSLYITLTDGAGSLASLSGSGDMTAAVYDPNAVAADVFDVDNHVSGTSNKVYTAAEQTKLAAISGTNTGDQTTITGNAGTATKLQTARLISGTSFDGSANITLNNTGITNGAGYITGSSPTITTPAIVGTSTNNNASAGNVGEFISASVASGSAISQTTGTATNITSLSLTAGDWDVSGIINFTGNAATTVTALGACIATTSATFSVTPGFHAITYCNGGTAFSNALSSVTTAIPRCRFSLNATTTVYLIAYPQFAVNTCTAYGSITARRRR